MRRQRLALCLMLALAACKGGGDVHPDAGPDPDDDPNAGSPFTRLTLDATANDRLPLSLAVGPGDVIGVAYFFRVAPGSADYEIRYQQVEGGQVSAPEKIATVQRVNGVSLAFDASGRPAVAYLGGQSDDSAFWYQSDLAVSFRTGPGQWTTSIPATRSNSAPSGNAFSDNGVVVGLNPAIVFNGTQAIVAYRDVHGGQFPTDYDGADVEVATGGTGGWTLRVAALGGDSKLGYGGHISMVMANGQPALVHDKVLSSADNFGSDVLFQRRNADGSWTLPFKVQTVANAQQGASLAWDPALGYGIAVVNRSSSLLTFVECKGTTATRCTAITDWTTPDPVYQTGTGGWFPSLAIDPSTHEPSIAFYNCSSASGANEGGCNANDDELIVSTRIEGNWREVLVDADGGWTPKMAYLSSGQRVIAYRDPAKGNMKLAVER
ncbi:MAG TPA: hypothetical protein VGX50_00380 [Longimicrobium sp.]|nr:hypothetical protein [Longimicrobium sp.]